MEDTLNRPAQYGGAKLIIGIFFILHGLLLTADNLDLLNAWHYLQYWPAVMLLVGLYKIWQPGSQVAGLILTVLGAALLAGSVGLWHVSLFKLWPLLLIIAGVTIVAKATGFEIASADRWNIVGVLSTHKSAPKQFSGARIAAFMGGVVLDLTEAEMPQSPAIIEVFTMWGGVEIYVPDTWDVIGELVPFMAGFEVKVAPSVAPQRRLIIRGTAVMAGIEVKRRKS